MIYGACLELCALRCSCCSGSRPCCVYCGAVVPSWVCRAGSIASRLRCEGFRSDTRSGLWFCRANGTSSGRYRGGRRLPNDEGAGRCAVDSVRSLISYGARRGTVFLRSNSHGLIFSQSILLSSKSRRLITWNFSYSKSVAKNSRRSQPCTISRMSASTATDFLMFSFEFPRMYGLTFLCFKISTSKLYRYRILSLSSRMFSAVTSRAGSGVC